MNQTEQRKTTSEFVEIELRELKEQLADAWWHEHPLERIESIERQIEERSTTGSDSEKLSP